MPTPEDLPSASSLVQRLEFGQPYERYLTVFVDRIRLLHWYLSLRVGEGVAPQTLHDAIYPHLRWLDQRMYALDVGLPPRSVQREIADRAREIAMGIGADAGTWDGVAEQIQRDLDDIGRRASQGEALENYVRGQDALLAALDSNATFPDSALGRLHEARAHAVDAASQFRAIARSFNQRSRRQRIESFLLSARFEAFKAAVALGLFWALAQWVEDHLDWLGAVGAWFIAAVLWLLEEYVAWPVVSRCIESKERGAAEKQLLELTTWGVVAALYRIK